MRAILYVKTGCEFCDDARRRLEGAGVLYDEIDVSDRRETIPELLKLTRGKVSSRCWSTPGAFTSRPAGGPRSD